MDLILITLAGWRFAYLIVNEDGPGNIMGRLREQAQSQSMEVYAFPFENAETALRIRPGSLGKLLTCFRCASVWGAALAWLLLKTPLRGVVTIAAGSAAAILISEYVGVE